MTHLSKRRFSFTLAAALVALGTGVAHADTEIIDTLDAGQNPRFATIFGASQNHHLGSVKNIARGDFDNDGLVDLLVGNNFGADTSAYLIYGREQTPLVTDLLNAGSLGHILNLTTSVPGDQLGQHSSLEVTDQSDSECGQTVGGSAGELEGYSWNYGGGISYNGSGGTITFTQSNTSSNATLGSCSKPCYFTTFRFYQKFYDYTGNYNIRIYSCINGTLLDIVSKTIDERALLDRTSSSCGYAMSKATLPTLPDVINPAP